MMKLNQLIDVDYFEIELSMIILFSSNRFLRFDLIVICFKVYKLLIEKQYFLW